MTRALRYLSVCSGIEAATQAWHPLGWRPVAFSEIEPFPCAVLAHRYPEVPNWGDMTRFKEWPDADVDVLCGGTPCQSFSVAGLRKGLDDPRGNLMLTFGGIAARYRPDWLAWENVPGVLSSERGRDFASFLGLVSGRAIDPPEGGWSSGGIVPGIADAYGVAWRMLDAQHVRTRRFPFALPQRRRRVFVVGYLGDWRRAAAVLFDRESLSGHPAPGRRSGQRPARTLAESPAGSGGQDDTADRLIAQHSPPVANPLTARMHKGVNTTMDEGQTMIAYGPPWTVRVLTPVECERLQGFPDDFTRIPGASKSGWRDVDKTEDVDDLRALGLPVRMVGSRWRVKDPDGPRYKAIGNSWAVNCAEWIGERIAEVDAW
ncbi:MAG: DNA cytosine methyltransferase [Pseudomonadota bacterium]